MDHSRSRSLVVISLLTLVAFAVRSGSLDAQSLWRDEVDALCYAFEFPHLIAWAVAPEAAGDLHTPCACPTLPFAVAGGAGEGALTRLTRAFGGVIRQNGPLYFLLLRGWVALSGTSEYAMRFFSLASGVLCVPLAYVLGRRLLGQRTGLVAALLVTLSPYLTWYSQEVKMYTLVSALTLLAIYGLRRAVEGDGWHWWAVQVVATSLAFYSHILVALLILVQVLMYFTWWPLGRRQRAGALISLVCLTLPYLPLVIWQAPLVLQERETGFDYHSLSGMAQILLTGWSMGIFGGYSLSWRWCRLFLARLIEWWLRIISGSWPWGAVQTDALVMRALDVLNRSWPFEAMLMSALALWGLVLPLPSSLFPPLASGRGRGGKNERGGRGSGEVLALLCWLLTPVLIVWLISLRQPLFTDRYLIWTAPAFYLLVALGLTSFLHFGGWGRWAMVLVVGLVLASNGVNLWQQATVPMKSDFRAAAAYVANRYTGGDLILFQIPHGRYTFDYYFSREGYAWAEGLYTNYRAPDGSYMVSEQEVEYRMQNMTAGYTAVWLVVTEAAMWDDRGLVQMWLEVNGERLDEAHFMRVDVYRYVR